MSSPAFSHTRYVRWSWPMYASPAKNGADAKPSADAAPSAAREAFGPSATSSTRARAARALAAARRQRERAHRLGAAGARGRRLEPGRARERRRQDVAHGPVDLLRPREPDLELLR